MSKSDLDARVEALDRAMAGRWRACFTACGIDTHLLDGKQRPCPVCGGTDRFIFDDKFGRGDFFCRQCGYGNGIELVRRFTGTTFMQALRTVESFCGIASPEPAPCRNETAEDGKADDLGRQRRQLVELWAQAAPIVPGDPVWRYLESRGLNPRTAGWEVRCHPDLKYLSSDEDGRSFAAMLARVFDGNGMMMNLHRTFLTPEGGKADVVPCKKLMPLPVKGGAVRIGEIDGGELALAEGIETAMAVREMTGLPVWATLGCTNMQSFNVPEHVRKVFIYADNDAKFAGQAAAYALAHALAMRGVEVQVRVPERIGSDWLDVWNTYKTQS